MTPLAGIWAATLTPLSDDLTVHQNLLVSHVRWLLDRGCHGVVLLGTTGEANSFSVDERIAIMELLAEKELPLDRIIVGTGSTALPDAVTLTRRAQDLGYRAVLLLPPFYYKQVSDDGLYDFISQLIEEVGTDELEVVLYHFPAMAGIGYSMELISRLRTFYADQVIGIKDSSGDEQFLASLCTEFPEFGVFAGSERNLPLCMHLGGAGCVSATANVTSRLVRSVFDSLVDAAAESDATIDARAAEQIERMVAFRSALEKGPLVRVLKYLMATRSDNRSWKTLRPPFITCGPTEAEAIENGLSALPELPNFVS